MVSIQCRCGHVYYEQSNQCPICGSPSSLAKRSTKSPHGIGEDPNCECYARRDEVPFTQAAEAAAEIMKACRSNDFGRLWTYVNFEHRSQKAEKHETSWEVIDITMAKRGREFMTYHATIRIEPPANGKVTIDYSFAIEHTMHEEDNWDTLGKATIDCLQENCREQAILASKQLFAWIRDYDNGKKP